MLFRSTNAFYQENSYGQLSFPGDATHVTTNWYTIGYNKGTECSDPDITNWTLAANSAATTAGYVLGNYNNLIYLFPDNSSCGWAGLGEVGGTLTWINGYDNSRSEEHTSELQSHSFISYAVFCLKKKNQSASPSS